MLGHKLARNARSRTSQVKCMFAYAPKRAHGSMCAKTKSGKRVPGGSRVGQREHNMTEQWERSAYACPSTWADVLGA